MTAAPVCYAECVVSVPNQDQLTALVRTIAYLERDGIIQNHTSVSNPYRRALGDLATDPDLVPRVLGSGLQGGCVKNEDMTSLAKEKGWGYWTANFALYGASAAIMDAQWDLVQDRISQAVPGAPVRAVRHYAELGQQLQASKLPLTEIPHTGFPGIHNKVVMDLRGPGGGHLSFSPLFPTDGVALQEWFANALRLAEEAGFDLFADFHIYGRYVIGIVLVVYTPAEAERAKNFFESLLDDAERNGISEYRTHIGYMDRVRKQFDFGDNALGRMLSSIKGLLDPSGVLSQGKSGIWTESTIIES